MNIKSEIESLAKEIRKYPSPEYKEVLGILEEMVMCLSDNMKPQLKFQIKADCVACSQIHFSVVVRSWLVSREECVLKILIPNDGYPVTFDHHVGSSICDAIVCNNAEELVEGFAKILKRPEKRELIRSLLLLSSYS